MSERTTDDILASIVRVTEQSDLQMLDTSLVSTLYELLNIDTIALSHVVFHYGEPEVHLVIEINPDEISAEGMLSTFGNTPLTDLPDFKHCYDSLGQVELAHSNNQVHTIHPLTNGKYVVIGFLELYGAPLNIADKHLLDGLLKIHRNYAHLIDESERDTLTRLLNRRTFDRNLRQILRTNGNVVDINKSERKNRPIRRQGADESRNWLAVIDIDHFKKINDRYGHLYGDEVLILLANIMRLSFRGYDRLFRFGGEEFVAVLKNTSAAGAINALERFRNDVATHDFPQVGKVSVSIGFVEIVNHEIPAAILGNADKALYYAKAHGRNQTHSFEKLVAQGEIKAPYTSDDVEVF